VNTIVHIIFGISVSFLEDECIIYHSDLFFEENLMVLTILLAHDKYDKAPLNSS